MTVSSFGRLHANAVAWARTSGGKTLRRARSGQIVQALALAPAPPPFPHCPISASNMVCNLLVAPFWMFVSIQHNPRTHHFHLWRVSPSHQLAQFFYLVFKELDWVVRFRSSHLPLLPTQVYIILFGMYLRNPVLRFCTEAHNKEKENETKSILFGNHRFLPAVEWVYFDKCAKFHPTIEATLSYPVGRVEPFPDGCLYMEFFAPSDNSKYIRDQSGHISAVITPIDRTEYVIEQWTHEEFKEAVYSYTASGEYDRHIPGVVAWEYVKQYLQPEDEIWTFGFLDSGFVIIREGWLFVMVVTEHSL
ncbi:MAG: hypothetical protein ACOY0R_01880 [Chloroflexota bacterium]